jgi:hypothetical protein
MLKAFGLKCTGFDGRMHGRKNGIEFSSGEELFGRRR